MTNDSSDIKNQQIKVAKIIDEYTIVINKGAKDGIKPGQRFLIYVYGDEVIDPNTKLVLEKLEIVKGTGRVTHLQEFIATIRSDMIDSPSRSVRRVRHQSTLGGWLAGLVPGEVEEILPAKAIPFEGSQVGDLVKPI